MRRPSRWTPEECARALAEEWDRLPGDLKGDLLARWPRGYFAVAHMARREQIEREMEDDS